MKTKSRKTNIRVDPGVEHLLAKFKASFNSFTLSLFNLFQLNIVWHFVEFEITQNKLGKLPIVELLPHL